MPSPVTVGRALSRRPRRLTLVVLLTGALSASWALVSPLASVPDEPAHVLYAAAVVRGELGSGPLGREVVVPAEVAVAGGLTCTAFRPDTTAECRQPFVEQPGSAATITSAGRYPPLYYAIVGLPTLFGFGAGQWVAMRMLSVLLGCLLLGVATLAWRRDPLPLTAGVALGVTPMTAFLLGSVNPNGAEIVAGVAVMLAGCGLIDSLAAGSRPSRRAYAGLLLPLTYLSLARPSSYVVAVALLTVLGCFALPALTRLGRRSTALLVIGSLTSVAAGVVAARSVALPTASADPGVVPISLRGAATITVHRAAGWLQETVGIFGWRDHQPPLLLSLLWLAGIGGVLVMALVRGAVSARLSLLALAVGGSLVAPFFVLVTLFRDGIGYQGRYAMALTQSLPVLACAVMARRSVSPRESRLWRLVPAAALLLGLLCLAGSALRYGVGLPLPGGVLTTFAAVVWVPPLWPVVLVLVLMSVCIVGQLARAEPVPAQRASMLQ